MVKTAGTTRQAPKLTRDTHTTALQKLAIFLLRCYQLAISPLLGPRCRFYPSCSQYAVLAITEHGVCSGTGMALKRLLKCHPGHPGGIDDVPEKSACEKPAVPAKAS